MNVQILTRRAARLLQQAHATVAVAESCTAGMLGAALTAYAGSSAFFRGGVIAYANDVKQALLRVPARTLEAHGAVSGQTAKAMAAGVRRLVGAEYGVAITGVAGPGGGTRRKPVGTVWTGVAGPAGAVARLHHFKGARAAVRRQAVAAALLLLAEAVSGRMTDAG